MSRADRERLGKDPDDAGLEDVRDQIEGDRELSDEELEQAAGGDDGWGTGTGTTSGGG